MKKRYNLTLTQENVEKFQALCKQGGLPPVTLSLAVDDFLRDIAPVMEKATETGKFSVVDFFQFLGQQVEQAMLFEEVRHAEKRKETSKKGS